MADTSPPREAKQKDGSFRYLYVVWDYKSNHAKIGCTKYPRDRLQQLQAKGNEHRAMLWTKWLRHARSVEELAHGMLMDHRVEGEWFSTTPEAAISVVEAAERKVREYWDAGEVLQHRSPHAPFYEKVRRWRGRLVLQGKNVAAIRRAGVKVTANASSQPAVLSLTQKGASLYDQDGNRIAWISVIHPIAVCVDGARTAAELRLIADWIESQ